MWRELLDAYGMFSAPVTVRYLYCQRTVWLDRRDWYRIGMRPACGNPTWPSPQPRRRGKCCVCNGAALWVTRLGLKESRMIHRYRRRRKCGKSRISCQCVSRLYQCNIKYYISCVTQWTASQSKHNIRCRSRTGARHIRLSPPRRCKQERHLPAISVLAHGGIHDTARAPPGGPARRRTRMLLAIRRL